MGRFFTFVENPGALGQGLAGSQKRNGLSVEILCREASSGFYIGTGGDARRRPLEGLLCTTPGARVLFLAVPLWIRS